MLRYVWISMNKQKHNNEKSVGLASDMGAILTQFWQRYKYRPRVIRTYYSFLPEDN